MTNQISSSDPTKRLLRLKDVLALIPVSRSTFYSGLKGGRFPAPVTVGRIPFWRSEDVASWITDPANSQISVPPEVKRLAGKSRLFQKDLRALTEVARGMELVALSLLLNVYDSHHQQNEPNEYDRTCSERLRKRREDLSSGGMPSLDMMQYWRTQ